MYVPARNPARRRPSARMGVVPVVPLISVVGSLFGNQPDVAGEADPNVPKIRAIRDTNVLATIARGDVTDAATSRQYFNVNGPINWGDGKVGRAYEKSVAQQTLSQLIQGLDLNVVPTVTGPSTMPSGTSAAIAAAVQSGLVSPDLVRQVQGLTNDVNNRVNAAAGAASGARVGATVGGAMANPAVKMAAVGLGILAVLSLMRRR